VKCGSDAQPFVGTDFGSFGAQRTVVNETSRLVDDKEVQKYHAVESSGFQTGELKSKQRVLVLIFPLSLLGRI
jgi:hypothetical protein